jgi:hypothetical protein
MRQGSWRDNRQWQYGRVTSSASRDMWVLWLFTLVLVGFSVAVVGVVLPQDLDQEHWAVLLVLAFPLAGLAALYKAILRTLEWRRFGRLVLELDPFPGSLGGDAGGWVDLAIPFDRHARFEVTLSCVHSRVSGTGRHRNRQEEVSWRDQAMLPGEFGTRGTRVRFCFALPERLPETEPPSDDYHYWAVHLKAFLPGVDLDRTFQVPVFETAEPRQARYRVQTPETGRPPELPRHIVRASRTTEGLRLDYPAARNRGPGLAVTLAGLFFTGIFLFMAWQSRAWLSSEDGVLTLPVVFGGLVLLAFGVVGIALVSSGLYLLTNSLQVLVGQTALVTRRRLLGIPVRLRHVAREHLVGVDQTIAGQSGQGARATVRYSLFATLAGGARVALGDGLKGRALADQVLGMVREACGCHAAAGDEAASPPGESVRGRRVAEGRGTRWVAVLVGVIVIGASAYQVLAGPLPWR